MRKLFYIVIIAIITLFYSCADQIVESTPSVDQLINNTNIVSAKFPDIQNKVFNKSCALSGCHVAGVQSPNLSVNAYNIIVNKPSTQGMNYIQAGNPSQSYMYLKITGASGIFGTRMPKNGPPLSQSVIDSISTWISNGALNN